MEPCTTDMIVDECIQPQQLCGELGNSIHATRLDVHKEESNVGEQTTMEITRPITVNGGGCSGCNTRALQESGEKKGGV